MKIKEMMEYIDKYYDENDLFYREFFKRLSKKNDLGSIATECQINEYLSFDSDCLNNFRQDLLKEGLTKDTIRNTYINQLKDKITDINYMLLGQKEIKYKNMIKCAIISLNFANSQNEELNTDIKALIIITAISDYHHLLVVKEAINNSKFNEIFNKYFSGNKEEDIKKFLISAAKQFEKIISGIVYESEKSKEQTENDLAEVSAEIENIVKDLLSQQPL